MLDDISSGFMDAMPSVRRLIINQGVRYDSGVIPTSLCCPSRASTLTGRYAHSTGVYGVRANGYGGWTKFNQTSESSTLATQLRSAGYQTALVGKYLNRFYKSPDGFVPPGWDDFIGFRKTNYYNWSVGGTVNESFGEAPQDYSTDVLTDYAVDIVNSADPDRPLFLYYSPYSAHSPYVPAERHIDTWHPEPLYGGFNEADVSDKPRFVRDNPLVDEAELVLTQQRQHETLMSADEGFQRIYNALGSRVSNTLFVLMSDNGLMLGDHRFIGKDLPYQHSTGVPMAIRWDGHVDPGVSSRVTNNVDLTATIAEVAGVNWVTEGRSVLSRGRAGTVLEQTSSLNSLGRSEGQVPGKRHPAYCGWRTRKYLFVEWDQGNGREFYDYTTDPDELDNSVRDPAYKDIIQRMRSKAKLHCSPPPSGFSWK